MTRLGPWNPAGLVVCAALTLTSPASLPAAELLFPFVLPWNDTTPGITDLSGWLRPPAGGQGWVRVGPDGHFYAGQERLRFFGVNVSFSGGMPENTDADGVAGRLAKFGVNVVRFHHMDTSTWPNGLRRREGPGSGALEDQALDRLCWFLAKLKQRGIYANINLLVGRPFNAADGLPAEIETMDAKDRHVTGFFDERQAALQKDYARRLLNHINPYTQLALGVDPAVAFVEIHNENGLVHAWLGNRVDALPEVFAGMLRQQWNAWLKDHHPDTSALGKAWNVLAEPLGPELLVNGTFQDGPNRWVLERHAGAEAEILPTKSAAKSFLQIHVTKPGSADWHVQLNQGGFGVGAGRPHTLTFRARAPVARNISVGVSQAHEPWNNLGLSAAAALSAEWGDFRFVFNSAQEDTRARVVFGNLGGAGSIIELADVSLRPGGVVGLKEGESVENLSIGLFTKQNVGERTLDAQRDWMRFLCDTEERYWQSMTRFLKEELHVRALVTGTIMGCTPANLAASMDWVDTHAYWHHPQFPGRPWDSENWTVENRSMVDTRDNTLPKLALKRIVGKPHAVTEYNHAAPNTYGTEGFLLLAAYAALQDWDAIYVYSYAHARNQGWDGRRIPSFFDIDQHPAKMATLPAAVAMFLRGDIHAAKYEVLAGLRREQEIELLGKARAWSLVDAGTVGLDSDVAFEHRVGLMTEGRNRPDNSLSPKARSRSNPAEGIVVSDTRELTWDLSTPGRGVVTVNTGRTKAVIGHGGGRRFDLEGFVIEPGQTTQGNWSAIVMTEIGPKPSGLETALALGPVRPRAPSLQRWLVTATGDADNIGMQWKNPEKSSVGRAWGAGPSRVEGIPFVLSLPATHVKAWALDERGQRREAVSEVQDGGRVTLRFGPQYRTLWYEVEATLP